MNSCRWVAFALSLQIILLLKTEELNQRKLIISHRTQFIYLFPIHLTIIYFRSAMVGLNLKQFFVRNYSCILIFQMQAELNSIHTWQDILQES